WPPQPAAFLLQHLFLRRILAGAGPLGQTSTMSFVTARGVKRMPRLITGTLCTRLELVRHFAQTVGDRWILRHLHHLAKGFCLPPEIVSADHYRNHAFPSRGPFSARLPE